MKNILEVKSFELALVIVALSKVLKDKKEHVLSRQLLRSGTAVGALIREAQNAESKKDFIHKLAIAQKECDETNYWLDLLIASKIIENKDFIEAKQLSKEILKMIRCAIITSKKSLQK